MAMLNPDILKDVFYEIVKDDDVIRGSNRRIIREGFNAKNVDKFMMSGREPFQLVLDLCKKAKSPILYERCIVAQLPGIKFRTPKDDSDDEDYEDGMNFNDIKYYLMEKRRTRDNEYLVPGTQIPTEMGLFKPISLAIASSMTSLDIRGFSSALIPMLKSIDRELLEVHIKDTKENWLMRIDTGLACKKQLKNILEACTNIANVQNGVTVSFCSDDALNSLQAMKFFAIPCRKLTIKRAFFNTMHESTLDNPYLRNIRDLVIEGKFQKTGTIYEECRQFIAFIAKTFPNLQTLNFKFTYHGRESNANWNWNDQKMSQIFRAFPDQISGSACFKIVNRKLEEVNREKYPNVQKGADEYYQTFAVRDNFTFKFAYWYDVKREKKMATQLSFEAIFTGP